VRGALSAALAARAKGLKAIAVPEANAREAAVVD
jgi:predicted ATPase with chaperone activity